MLERLVRVWSGLSSEVRDLVESLCLHHTLSNASGEPHQDSDHSDLAEIVAAWPALSSSFKHVLLTIIRRSVDSVLDYDGR